VKLPDDWLAFTICVVGRRAIDYLRDKIAFEKTVEVLAAAAKTKLSRSVSSADREEFAELLRWVCRKHVGNERLVVAWYFFSFLNDKKKPSKRTLAKRFKMSRHRVRKILARAARLLQEFV